MAQRPGTGQMIFLSCPVPSVGPVSNVTQISPGLPCKQGHRNYVVLTSGNALPAALQPTLPQSSGSLQRTSYFLARNPSLLSSTSILVPPSLPGRVKTALSLGVCTERPPLWLTTSCGRSPPEA
ncbi:hypothetical protein HJG60_011801 [Phyllostomus discolor]|uniref:Uncharacterized protein n=1 Tax=Phyllostomus discolor TaxID=89673 RepID=A0A834DVY2_9CHIR|nr:hypothetical protein HJG60_011801 [Phyllostomus discolor]